MPRSLRGRLAALTLLWLLAVPSARAGPFTAGNLVVLTVGDGTVGVGTGAATAVSLLEYTTAGVATGAVVSFNSGAGGTRLTQSGSQSLEGSLSRSADGQYLMLAGYDAARGTPGVVDTSTSGGSANVVRVVGRVDFNGAVDLSTTTTNYSGASVRGAATTDGTRLYITGAADDVNGSLRTTTLGTTGMTTLVNATDVRVAHVINNQVYASTRFNSIVRTDVALPTGTSGVTELVTGIVDPVGFVILDQDGNGVVDTLYVANQENTASLLKYSSTDGTTWTARGSADLAGGLTGITAVKSGSAVDLYVTAGDGTVAMNTLQRYSDSAAFDANLTGTFSVLATASAGTAFRGVAFSPAAIPEPGALLLGTMAGVCLGAAAWRRGRRVAGPTSPTHHLQ